MTETSYNRAPKRLGEQNHRSQPAMAGEFLSEIQSVNTAIAGGWVQTFAPTSKCMKWIGLGLIAFGALLALDHRNWFVPGVFGVFILGYWYFVEREPDGVPPDESDVLHRDEQPTKLQESSSSFDLSDLGPFLQRLSPQITGGYTAKVIAHIADNAARMKHEEERSLEYQVVFKGQRVPLNIGLFKDDIEEITIYFHTPKPLADFIDCEMASFFAERSM